MTRNNADLHYSFGYEKGMFQTNIWAIHRKTGKVIGLMQYEHYPPTGTIKHLYVEPDHQRQGIATHMLRLGNQLADSDPTMPKLKHSNERTDSGNAFAKATGADPSETIIRSDDVIHGSVLGKNQIVVSKDEEYNKPYLVDTSYPGLEDWASKLRKFD